MQRRPRASRRRDVARIAGSAPDAGRSSSTSTARCSTSPRPPDAVRDRSRAAASCLAALYRGDRRRGRADQRPPDRRRRPRCFAPLTLPVAGQHGIERRDAAGAVSPARSRLRRRSRRAARGSPRSPARIPGSCSRTRDSTLALHYRLAPRPGRLARDSSPRRLRAGRRGVRRCSAARCVFELKPGGPRQGHGDRGVHARGAVSRPHAGVRRRRRHRRVRLRDRQPAGRPLGQGRRRADRGARWRAVRRRRGARAGSSRRTDTPARAAAR